MTVPAGFIPEEEYNSENTQIPKGFIEETSTYSPKSAKVAKGLKFFGWEPKPETIEPIRKQLVQKLQTPATEFVSSAFGGIGDIGSLLNEVIVRPLTEKMGSESVPFEETILGKIIPTSERLHKGFEEFAGEKLRPETTGEEIATNTLGFLGSWLGLGGKGIGKAGQLIGTNVKIPGVINTFLTAFAPATAYTAAKKADLPPWMQAASSIGASLLTHRLTNKSLNQIARDMYKKSDELSKNVMMPAEGLVNRLDKLQSSMSKGIETGPKSRINNTINQIKAKSSGGVIPLEDLVQIRKDTIEIGKEFTKDQLKGSEVFFRPLRSSLDSTINEFKNPEFQQAYRGANSIYRGIKESQRMEKFIKKHWTIGALGYGGNHVLNQLGYTSGIGAKTVSALPIAKTYNFMRALKRNPGFRKAYQDLLKNAAKENIPATTRSLKNFNKYYDSLNLEKEE